MSGGTLSTRTIEEISGVTRNEDDRHEEGGRKMYRTFQNTPLGTLVVTLPGSRPKDGGAQKTCGCGARYTYPEWRELARVGVQVFDWGEIQELRNCRCASTLAVILVEGEPE